MSSTELDIELRSRRQEDSTQISPHISPHSELEEAPPLPILRLLSCAFSFFVAGTNDGSIGALIPYMLSSYKIGTSFIAILYITTFLGWALAAVTNPYLSRYFALGTLLAIGSILQIIPHVLRAWLPPFPLFAITFFLSGLGQAYQDSHANTFVSAVKGGGAHRWLGFIHAMYGLGLVISPFAATAIATTGRWTLFYLFPLGLSVVNLALVGAAFRESVKILPKAGDVETEASQEPSQMSSGAMSEVKEMLKLKDIWVFSLFFFFHLGVCFTSAGMFSSLLSSYLPQVNLRCQADTSRLGWVVQYLLSRPDPAPLSKLGYVPSGAYTGIFLGRLILAEPTHRFGERRMLLIYSVICLVLQLVFWLVPNLVSSVVVFSAMGFFLGPYFAAVSLCEVVR